MNDSPLSADQALDSLHSALFHAFQKPHPGNSMAVLNVGAALSKLGAVLHAHVLAIDELRREVDALKQRG